MWAPVGSSNAQPLLMKYMMRVVEHLEDLAALSHQARTAAIDCWLEGALALSLHLLLPLEGLQTLLQGHMDTVRQFDAQTTIMQGIATCLLKPCS